MELVEGITLKKYIEKRGKLPYKEAVSIAIQVANGMEAAHKHHIVHRDIKPQNIIISKEGKVKVTDFGIAKAATSSTINSSAAMGSVHYMSPEQARGGYSDERSDIYSFGITLYEMLTGKVPFDGDTTVAVAVQHIQDAIPAPSEIAEDVPLSVDKIAVFVIVKLVGGVSFGGKSEKTTAQTTQANATTASSEKVSVPNVVGKTEDEAKEELNKVGLGYKASYQASSTVEKGNVISQGTSRVHPLQKIQRLH